MVYDKLGVKTRYQKTCVTMRIGLCACNIDTVVDPIVNKFQERFEEIENLHFALLPLSYFNHYAVF